MAGKWHTVGITLKGGIDPSLGKSFAWTKNQGQDLRRELGKLRLGKRLAGDVAKYKGQLTRLRAAQERLGTGNAKLNRRIAVTHDRYLKAEGAAARYGIKLNDLTREQQRLAKATKAAERAQAAQAARQKRKQDRAAMPGQVMGIAAVGMSLAAPIKQAIKFESVMADVKKVVNFDNPQQFKKMGIDILDMSRKMPMAADGIAAIVAAAGQSGIARTELLGFAESATKMGVAFDLTGDEAGKMMANWRAGMKLSQAQAVALADSVNHLSNHMNVTAGDLGRVVQRMGPVAQASGLAAQETAALGAALLSSGARVEVAGTGLKNFLGALTKGGAATKAQQGAFAQLGLDAQDMAERMQTDAKGAIVEVLSAIKDLDAADQPAVISQLFGEESKAVIVPLLGNMANLTDAFDLVSSKTKYDGSMQAEYAERCKTTANALQLLSNQMAAAGTTIGNTLLPALKDVTGILSGAAEWVGKLAETHSGLIWVVGRAAAVLGGLKVATLAGKFAFGGLLDSIGAARKGFGLFRSGIGLVGKAFPAVMAAMKGLNLAMLTSPIGLIIGGIALAAGLIIANWDKVKAFFVAIWKPIKPVWDGFLKVIKTWFNWTPLGMIIKNWGPITKFFAKIWEPIKPIWEKFIGWIGKAVGGLMKPFKMVGKAFGWVANKLGLSGDASASTVAASAVKKAVNRPAGVSGVTGTSATSAANPRNMGSIPTLGAVPKPAPGSPADQVEKAAAAVITPKHQAPSGAAGQGGGINVSLIQHINMGGQADEAGIKTMFGRAGESFKDAVRDAMRQIAAEDRRLSYG